MTDRQAEMAMDEQAYMDREAGLDQGSDHHDRLGRGERLRPVHGVGV